MSNFFEKVHFLEKKSKFCKDSIPNGIRISHFSYQYAIIIDMKSNLPVYQIALRILSTDKLVLLIRKAASKKFLTKKKTLLVIINQQ